MAYTNTNTNMTSSTGLTPGMQTYYNRELLRTFEPELVHLQFGDEHRLPPNSGLVMNMRKIIPLETNTTALNEGDPGESVMLAETEVTVQLRPSSLAMRARAPLTPSSAKSWRPAPT